jgi:bis(5'-nucleosidyl)-tetraphosphatase
MKKIQYEESVGAVLSYKLISASSSLSPEINSKKEQYLLLKSPRGDWNFVKGHREKGETDYNTLKREIFEETGITKFNVVNYLGKINYRFRKIGVEIEKEVKFYYVNTESNDILLSNEHIDYVWLDYEQARRLLTFDQSKFILATLKNKLFS